MSENNSQTHSPENQENVDNQNINHQSMLQNPEHPMMPQSAAQNNSASQETQSNNTKRKRVKNSSADENEYPSEDEDDDVDDDEDSGSMGNTLGTKFINESDQTGKREGEYGEKKGGRRKINIEFIENKSRRHVTFSKRKAGLIKKAFELSTLTGTQVLLLVASETGNVYTFATPKLQPLITKPEGKSLIQCCLNPPEVQENASNGNSSGNSATANVMPSTGVRMFVNGNEPYGSYESKPKVAPERSKAPVEGYSGYHNSPMNAANGYAASMNGMYPPANQGYPQGGPNQGNPNYIGQPQNNGGAPPGSSPMYAPYMGAPHLPGNFVPRAYAAYPAYGQHLPHHIPLQHQMSPHQHPHSIPSPSHHPNHNHGGPSQGSYMPYPSNTGGSGSSPSQHSNTSASSSSVYPGTDSHSN